MTEPRSCKAYPNCDCDGKCKEAIEHGHPFVSDDDTEDIEVELLEDIKGAGKKGRRMFVRWYQREYLKPQASSHHVMCYASKKNGRRTRGVDVPNWLLKIL